jgi:hypothetical protein
MATSTRTNRVQVSPVSIAGSAILRIGFYTGYNYWQLHAMTSAIAYVNAFASALPPVRTLESMYALGNIGYGYNHYT